MKIKTKLKKVMALILAIIMLSAMVSMAVIATAEVEDRMSETGFETIQQTALSSSNGENCFC